MTTPDPVTITAEAMRPVAESSATAYIDLIASEGAEVEPHRAFVDGFMTAIELLLTAGERMTQFYNSIANAVGGRGNAIRLIWAGREIVGEAKALEALRAFGCNEIEGLRCEGRGGNSTFGRN